MSIAIQREHDAIDLSAPNHSTEIQAKRLTSTWNHSRPDAFIRDARNRLTPGKEIISRTYCNSPAAK
jgi:hypothetical protein